MTVGAGNVVVEGLGESFWEDLGSGEGGAVPENLVGGEVKEARGQHAFYVHNNGQSSVPRRWLFEVF